MTVQMSDSFIYKRKKFVLSARNKASKVFGLWEGVTWTAIKVLQ